MSIRDWPAARAAAGEAARARRRALTEAELLAILLGTGMRGQSALDVARTLLARVRLAARIADRRSTSGSARRAGSGPARYVVLQAALELTRRHYQEPMTAGSALANPQATREFLQMRLRDLPYEVFCCLFLDNRHRVIGFEELFRGTIDGRTSIRGKW